MVTVVIKLEHISYFIRSFTTLSNAIIKKQDLKKFPTLTCIYFPWKYWSPFLIKEYKFRKFHWFVINVWKLRKLWLSHRELMSFVGWFEAITRTSFLIWNQYNWTDIPTLSISLARAGPDRLKVTVSFQMCNKTPVIKLMIRLAQCVLGWGPKTKK